MNILPTPLAGMFEIRHTPARDARGRFTRLFCERELADIRPRLHFTQVNFSKTRGRGVVRGLHYQAPPASEAKLIRCLRGRVFDVAVDVRAGSPTFLRWHALELSGDNDRAVFVPEGFAHGFQVLSDHAAVVGGIARGCELSGCDTMIRAWQSPGRCRSPRFRSATADMR